MASPCHISSILNIADYSTHPWSELSTTPVAYFPSQNLTCYRNSDSSSLKVLSMQTRRIDKEEVEEKYGSGANEFRSLFFSTLNRPKL